MARNTRTADVDLKALVTRIANAKGVPVEKMGKQVRSRIRAEFDKGTLVPAKHYPAYAKAGKVNRDGNRYPAMPVATADALFLAMTKGKPLADSLKAPKRVNPAKVANAPTPVPAPEA